MFYFMVFELAMIDVLMAYSVKKEFPIILRKISWEFIRVIK